ncbi:MAG: MltA domain-containing protein [Hyphomicrobiales bacterium]|nr:MltA domain-containing protein [Hyphomicrobiales bacterium]MDE2114133.1 MltA domain-containing protein [Hyphomicrobiales bacterium]
MFWSQAAYLALVKRLKQQGAALQPVPYDDLAGFAAQDHRDLVAGLQAHCFAISEAHPATRPAQPADEAYVGFCRAFAKVPPPATAQAAQLLLENHWQPCRIRNGAPGDMGLLTGYYEPEVEGSLVQTAEFAAPLYARPADLVTFAQGQTPAHLAPHLAAARALLNGELVAFFTRSEIESAARQNLQPLIYVRDLVEAFLIQVQGSARVRTKDGGLYRIGYAGRNGHPYTSIGRILIQRGDIPEASMSLAGLKQWIRDAGQELGEAGHELMLANRSFVFFRLETALSAQQGPIGAAGLSLTPLQSIAVDRQLWLYGLPFWIESQLPWRSSQVEPFSRLMLAQDTGSAILGPARADIFFGTGLEAGARAGDIRHPARFTVLLPKRQATHGPQ